MYSVQYYCGNEQCVKFPDPGFKMDKISLPFLFYILSSRTRTECSKLLPQLRMKGILQK